jgi:hypothetical protein
MKCIVCEENEATLRVTVVKIKDDTVWDSSDVCYDCLKDPAGEICLVLPDKEGK